MTASDAVPNESRDGTVVGRVMLNGRSVPEATVMIVEGHASHPDLAALTDNDGGFVLGGLDAGWYNLEARLGDRVARRSVELAAGEHVTVTFAL